MFLQNPSTILIGKISEKLDSKLKFLNSLKFIHELKQPAFKPVKVRTNNGMNYDSQSNFNNDIPDSYEKDSCENMDLKKLFHYSYNLIKSINKVVINFQH